MIVVHVGVVVLPGTAEQFVTATLANARASLTEPGVVRFDLLRAASDSDHFLLVEIFIDEPAAAAHKETAHYATWRDTVAPFMARSRTAQRYEALFPVDPRRWRAPSGEMAETMGWEE